MEIIHFFSYLHISPMCCAIVSHSMDCWPPCATSFSGLSVWGPHGARTRSDPGGSCPPFTSGNSTPSSVCGGAVPVWCSQPTLVVTLSWQCSCLPWLLGSTSSRCPAASPAWWTLPRHTQVHCFQHVCGIYIQQQSRNCVCCGQYYGKHSRLCCSNSGRVPSDRLL